MKELTRPEHTDDERSDRDSGYTGVDVIESHPGKDDAWKGDFKCLLIPVTLPGC